MDTQARIEAATARLEANRAVLIRAKEAGPPCSECRWYVPPSAKPRMFSDPIPAAYCGHVACGVQRFDAVTGGAPINDRTTIADARGPDGLCGFEATLFEDKPQFWPIVGSLVGAAVWASVGLTFVFFAAVAIFR